MTATALAKSFWANREPGLSTEQWARRYWDSVDAPYRVELRQVIQQLVPFSTLLEVGSHCGPNLRGMARDHPGAVYFGMDPSTDAVMAGRLFCANEGLHQVGLSLGALPDGLHDLADARVDIVLSCYALSYLSPDDVGQGINEMCRVARKAVVMAEPNHAKPVFVERGSYIEWCHDYASVLEMNGWGNGWLWTERRLVHPHERLDGIWVGVRQ